MQRRRPAEPAGSPPVRQVRACPCAATRIAARPPGSPRHHGGTADGGLRACPAEPAEPGRCGGFHAWPRGRRASQPVPAAAGATTAVRPTAAGAVPAEGLVTARAVPARAAPAVVVSAVPGAATGPGRPAAPRSPDPDRRPGRASSSAVAAPPRSAPCSRGRTVAARDPASLPGPPVRSLARRLGPVRGRPVPGAPSTTGSGRAVRRAWARGPRGAPPAVPASDAPRRPGGRRRRHGGRDRHRQPTPRCPTGSARMAARKRCRARWRERAAPAAAGAGPACCHGDRAARPHRRRPGSGRVSWPRRPRRGQSAPRARSGLPGVVAGWAGIPARSSARRALAGR